MHYTGLAKYLKLAGTLKMKPVRGIPLRVLFRLQGMYADAKLTRVGDAIVINSFLPPFPCRPFGRLALSVQAALRAEVIPVSCYIGLTNRCNFNCWHCSKALRRDAELPLAVVEKAIKGALDLGACIIGFTGGEPLMREDLEGIIRGIGERASALLFTTGDGLTRQRAAALKAAGLFGIAVSLDSPDGDVHNRLRGSADAFGTATNAVRVSLENEFFTMLQVVARKDFIDHEIWPYIEFAKDLGAHEIRVIEPMPTGSLINAEDCLLSQEERQMLKDIHVEVNRRKDYPTMSCFAYIEDECMYGCGAGIQHMYIDAQGDVCPCDFTPLSFGNVNEENLDIIWARLREAFARPRSTCFLLENSAQIRAACNGELPLDTETSMRICRKCAAGTIPEYYRILGWK